MAFWLETFLIIAGLLIVTDLLVHVVYAFVARKYFETLPAFHVLPPPQETFIPEPIQFSTTNDLQLRGGVYFPEDGHPRGIVIFCPETGGAFDTVMNYAEALVESGFAVVAFSFRNEHPSDVQPDYQSNYWVTQYEVDDVQAAIDFVTSMPQFLGLPIGLMGVSRGAGAALAAGATRPEVSRIWVQGAFSTEGLAVLHAVKFLKSVVGSLGKLIPVWHVRVTIWFMLRLSEYLNKCRLIHLESLLPRWRDREVMFVSGSRDTYVPVQLSESLLKKTRHPSETSLWVVPQAKHNLERPTAPQEFDRQLVQFFEPMGLPVEIAPATKKKIVAK